MNKDLIARKRSTVKIARICGRNQSRKETSSGSVFSKVTPNQLQQEISGIHKFLKPNQNDTASDSKSESSKSSEHKDDPAQINQPDQPEVKDQDYDSSSSGSSNSDSQDNNQKPRKVTESKALLDNLKQGIGNSVINKRMSQKKRRFKSLQPD